VYFVEVMRPSRFTSRLAQALENHRPTEISNPGRRPASVAMVAADSGEHDAEILLIQRARRESDPWSGHLAFPGGRVDATDPTRRFAAERETREEVGLDLEKRGRFLGRLNDLGGAGHPVTVSAFAYLLDAPTGNLRLEDNEVEDAFWVPVAHILDRDRWTHHSFSWEGRSMSLPAIDLGLGPGKPVLWGLTYRFIVDVMHMLGHDEVPRAW